MRKGKEIFLAILLGIILPLLLLYCPKTKNETAEDDITIAVLMEDGVKNMDIEEYVLGVLLGELPGDFETEAIKAQAVAARTFALYRKERQMVHQDADVCTQSICCQAYMDPSGYIANGGTADVVSKMRQCVQATKSEVLFYRGELIDATYFSSTGGRTEDAQAVWGSFVPYLQSVVSGEIENPQTICFSKKDFCTALGLPVDEVRVDAPIYTTGGGLENVLINGISFTGTQLRQSLGLRSTQITFTVDKDSVQITTNGYGHRVGMSQYGAEAMATRGSNYKKILKHYYSGVTIGRYSAVEN